MPFFLTLNVPIDSEMWLDLKNLQIDEVAGGEYLVKENVLVSKSEGD